MQPYVTTSGLLALALPLLIAIVLVAFSVHLRERRKGWSHVTPGLSYWLPFVLGLGLALLITWVWTFVGSARRDADFQMRVAWWLALAFGLMSTWCAWRIFGLERQSMRWRGDKIAWKEGSKLVERSLVGAASITTNFVGQSVVKFTGGECLRLDASAQNSSELIARIEELNGLADPNAPPEH